MFMIIIHVLVMILIMIIIRFNNFRVEKRNVPQKENIVYYLFY